MASRGGGCLRPCPCPHAGTLGRPDRSSCGGLPANLDPRWTFCQYPDDLGFYPSMQVRRLLGGEDWCRRTGARSEERG
jgi:hypothetical protein